MKWIFISIEQDVMHVEKELTNVSNSRQYIMYLEKVLTYRSNRTQYVMYLQ